MGATGIRCVKKKKEVGSNSNPPLKLRERFSKWRSAFSPLLGVYCRRIVRLLVGTTLISASWHLKKGHRHLLLFPRLPKSSPLPSCFLQFKPIRYYPFIILKTLLLKVKVAVKCVEYLPNQETDVKLATIERGSGGDGSSNGDPVVGLHETRAKQVVASRCLIRIRLCPLKLQPCSLDTNCSSCISLLLHM